MIELTMSPMTESEHKQCLFPVIHFNQKNCSPPILAPAKYIILSFLVFPDNHSHVNELTDF